MSHRKRYRKIRNKKLKDNLEIFEANRRKNQKEIEAKEVEQQVMRAAMIYDDFKTIMCSEIHGLSAPQIIARVEATKDAIAKVVKDAYTRGAMIEMITRDELKFLAAFGPKTAEQKAAWRAEAKALRTSVRMPEPPAADSSDPSRN